MLNKAKRALQKTWRRFTGLCVSLWENIASRNAPEEETDQEFADLENTMVRRNAVRRVDSGHAADEDLSDTRMFARVEPKPWQNTPRRETARQAGGAGLHEDEQVLVSVPQRQKPFALAILFTSMKLMVVAVFFIGCFCLGIGLGIARAYVETTPELDTALLTKSDLTSYIYDCNGDMITTFAGMEYREWANMEEIPDMLINAVIAVEDVRFYKHEGLDFKRLFSAVINTLRNTDTHGGSTITQQLIKNKLLTLDQTYKRKIQEAYLAVELEQIMEKNDILEAYLNDVYLGESNYGVKSAAKDYFGKELSQLTLRECAMLAGMVQKPYYTNPRSNLYRRTLTDNYTQALEQAYEDGYITLAQYQRSKQGDNRIYITDQRTNTVLYAMYTNGFISREQYDSAMTEEIQVMKTSEQSELYDMPYFVEYAVRDVVTHLLAQRNLLDTTTNRTALENELRTGGYHIYTTVDPKIQNTVQTTLSTWDQYPGLADPSAALYVTTNKDGSTTETVQPQAAAVVLDHATGQLKAVVGGRDEPTVKKGWNRAYQSATPVGSSIKPLAVYGPALDLGASPASIIMNFEVPIEGYGGKGYPSIGDKDYKGLVTIRRGVTSSLNIVAARTLFEYVTLEKSQQYLIDLGVDASRINVDGPGLALGTSGITPIEMAGAYGAIANGGMYLEPISFTKVVDSQGNVVLDAQSVQQKRQVFQQSTAYLLVDMLTDAATSGTGYRAKISGMTVAGKTGTNSDYSSVYFAGITPYYVGTVWIGHDLYAQKLKSGATGGRYAAPLWKAFMQPIHEGLENRSIIDATPASLGLVKATVCSVSGKLATDACKLDASGHFPVTDWFTEGSKPMEYCDMHAAVSVCAQSHMQATSGCPNVTTGSIILVNSLSKLRTIPLEELKTVYPNVVLSDIAAEDYSAVMYENSALCTLHWGGAVMSQLEQARAEAERLAQQISSFISATPGLKEADRDTLVSLTVSVNQLTSYVDAQSIQTALNQYRAQYQQISSQYQQGGPVPDEGGATPEPDIDQDQGQGYEP